MFQSGFLENLKTIATSVRFFDILDIIFVAILFYVLLVRFRYTSAWRIMIAIGIMVVITGITDLAKMRAMNYLLSKMLEIGFIALIILFQPELRRALERFGAKSMLLVSGKHDTLEINQQAISRVVTACEIMAKEKTGVLLVFEREITLDDYFKSGTIVDAEISTELLRNLFFTKASLHDGAVVIQKGRIAAAGCVLPLTDNTRISSDLGTRHRAGIGMSEATDAVVVIVSEETGTISIAVDGMLKRNLTPEMLRKLLTTELHMDDAGSGEFNLKALVTGLLEGKLFRSKEYGKKENKHE